MASMIGWGLLVFISFSAIFALAVKKGMALVGKAFGKTVHDRHKSAERILEDGKVPSWWYEEFVTSRHGHGLRNTAGEVLPDQESRRRARLHFLKRLDGLLKYFRTAPVFENDEARRLLLEDLRTARDRWLNSPWREIVPGR